MSLSFPKTAVPQGSFLDQVFRDREGQIVIAQMPNPPLLVGLGATLLQQFLPKGSLRSGVETVAFIALLIWACQETFEGVNAFRRSLGLTVLVSLVALKLRSEES